MSRVVYKPGYECLVQGCWWSDGRLVRPARACSERSQARSPPNHGSGDRNSAAAPPALLDYCAVPTRSVTMAMNPKSTLAAELLAEFLGTFVLMLFGTGVVAMVLLFPSTNPGETIHG